MLPSTIVTSTTLDVLVLGWLDAKFHKSNSPRTIDEYKKTIGKFRTGLQNAGLDLDSEEADKIALLAQAFAGGSKSGEAVKPATYNNRLAILSSFYEYAIKNKALDINPVSMVERGKVQAYAGAKPLDCTSDGLEAIDRTTLRGKRDYALLAILLSTGRRASEVASLTLADIDRRKGKITLTFSRCKGGKVMRDSLPSNVASVLVEWLSAFYGPNWQSDNRPCWVVLRESTGCTTSHIGDQLSTQSLSDICKKHLGVSKVHATRHTWAYQMEKAGAKVSFIQAKLGHESLATTGRYLAALTSDENDYAETIAASMGIR
jgi:site-specific recombinase XerD